MIHDHTNVSRSQRSKADNLDRCFYSGGSVNKSERLGKLQFDVSNAAV